MCCIEYLPPTQMKKFNLTQLFERPKRFYEKDLFLTYRLMRSDYYSLLCNFNVFYWWFILFMYMRVCLYVCDRFRISMVGELVYDDKYLTQLITRPKWLMNWIYFLFLWYDRFVCYIYFSIVLYIYIYIYLYIIICVK